jgi:hypothetical protein
MEQQQFEVLQKLLEETPLNEVEEGQRVYTSSSVYGSSRYHLLDKVHDGVQIEQMDIDEKWSKRINFCLDELPFVLKALLTWYLEAVQQQPINNDLDEHPF